MNNFLNKMQTKISPSFIKEKGATMLEYAIMIALIAVVSIAIITSLGQRVSTTFSTVNSSMAAG